MFFVYHQVFRPYANWFLVNHIEIFTKSYLEFIYHHLKTEKKYTGFFWLTAVVAFIENKYSNFWRNFKKNWGSASNVIEYFTPGTA